MQPRPKEEEICFILEAISEYLTVDVRRSDVLSTWAGIRPLATDPNAHDTASASRDHIATVDPDGLLTITGELHCWDQLTKRTRPYSEPCQGVRAWRRPPVLSRMLPAGPCYPWPDALHLKSA